MALTDPKIRQAKPKEKPYKISDEKGLFLEVKPNGAYQYSSKRIGTSAQNQPLSTQRSTQLSSESAFSYL